MNARFIAILGKQAYKNLLNDITRCTNNGNYDEIEDLISCYGLDYDEDFPEISVDLLSIEENEREYAF